MIANATSAFGSNQSMDLLSRLLLQPESGTTRVLANPAEFGFSEITQEEFDALAALASSNHVIMRALQVFAQMAKESGDSVREGWAATALATESARIDNAISFLRKICDGFEAAGYDVTVIKSLDHWPDLGSDLDLYTNTDPDDVIRLMQQRFQAELAPRSWGDRLAKKWNFN